MKSKRFTIFCVAVIALVGTPRAWHEAGKLLAIVQHKAQVRFWSMAMQPGDKASASRETIAAAAPLKASSAEIAANCPLERRESKDYRIASNLKTNRKAVSVGLTAKALKAQRENSDIARLFHSRSIPESLPPIIAESRASSLQSLRTLPHSPMSNGDKYRFVELPMLSPAAVSVLAEKETVVQFKLLKKTVEDSKWIRQRVHLPVSRPVTAVLPSS